MRLTAISDRSSVVPAEQQPLHVGGACHGLLALPDEPAVRQGVAKSVLGRNFSKKRSMADLVTSCAAAERQK